GLVRRVRAETRKWRPDAIVSYLAGPGMLGLVASLGRNRIPVVVSERSWNYRGVDFDARRRFLAFRIADRIVVNSASQLGFIQRNFPAIAQRSIAIFNCVDTDRFVPALPRPHQELRIVVAASVAAHKNVLGFVEALRLVVAREPSFRFHVDWFGKRGREEGGGRFTGNYFSTVAAKLENDSLGGVIRFKGAVNDLHLRLPAYDVCCLPSFYEGCPNAICEAMAAGKPVLASGVGDNLVHVKPNRNGLLFNPADSSSIADCILEFSKICTAERTKMGAENRRYAVESFSPASFLRQYEELLHSIVRS
ncbi:MAG: glycosyltransferase family 4 protein, partial [Planctomycetales bacterium]|nr:glycosyltransferase family 4 protein [Planctomycetales bacterium]